MRRRHYLTWVSPLVTEVRVPDAVKRRSLSRAEKRAIAERQLSLMHGVEQPGPTTVDEVLSQDE